MKNLKLCLIYFIVSISCLAMNSNVFGGGNANGRRSCAIFAKYTANVFILTILPPLFILHRDHGCGYAEAEECYIPMQGCGCVAYAHAKAGNGITPFVTGYSQVWWASTGKSYSIPTTAPPIELQGYTSYQMEVNTLFDSLNHSVVLTGFNGALSVKQNSNSGSTLLIVVWIPDSELDSTITINKVLWKGNARLEYGNLIANGFLDSTDFNVSTALDSSAGILVRKAVPIAGLTKTLTINNTISLDSIEISIFGECGYGAFNESDIILPNSFVNTDYYKSLDVFNRTLDKNFIKPEVLKYMTENK